MDIFIVDDHPLFSESVVTTLAPTFLEAVFTEYKTFGEVLPELQKQCPDLILLDLNLPDTNGLEAIKQILALHPEARILMLSGSENVLDMRQCIDAGAMGYLMKTESAEQLLEAIKTVLTGGSYVPQALIDAIPLLDQQKKITDSITQRHIDVLILMREGKRNKEIGNAFDISEATVKVHCRDLFRVLGVNNRNRAVQEALRLGVLKQ